MSDKHCIIASLWGVPQGYIKSISYQTGKFKITKDKANAKGYTNLDKLQGDIDLLTKYHNCMGYIFMYE